MIPLSLREIAEVTGGTVHGDGGIVVDAPAMLDSRAVEPGGLFVALAGEHTDGHDHAARAVAAGAAAVLASREVDVPAVLVADVTAALGRLARHVLDQLEDTTVVAITGSSGKTSAKDLVAHLLEPDGMTVATSGNLNNELGVPLTVLRADELTRYLVVEMGARGPGDIAALCAIAPPDLGVVLNVGTAHIGEFGTVEVIARTKGELAAAVSADGVVVLNADDHYVAAMAERTEGAVMTFGAAGDVAVRDLRVDDAGSPLFTLVHHERSVPVHIPLIGDYHAWNAAAAAAVALALGVDLSTIARRLAAVTSRTPMRMERHERSDGVVVINDAYNANPESMAAALRAVAALGGPAVAVLGEMLELGEGGHTAHVEVGRLAAVLGYTRVIAVGDGARGIAEGAGDIAISVPDVDVAVRTLSASLSGDEVVLVKASRGGRLERVANALIEG